MIDEPVAELILRGTPISKGVGIGAPIFLSLAEEEVSEAPLSECGVEDEVERYRRALSLSRSDLQRLQLLSDQDEQPEVTAILGTHLEMIEDPLLTQEVEARIRSRQRKTETIFHHLITEYRNRFTVLQDSYFRERVRDIVDLSRRIITHLHSPSTEKGDTLAHRSVLISHELMPSETIESNAAFVAGFISMVGGLSSHAAIIARAKGIPYVANIDIILLERFACRRMIIDGSEGIIIVNPSRKTLLRYMEIQKRHGDKERSLQGEVHKKTETHDGLPISLFANLEDPDEVTRALRMGAEGVGLFRSEYLFLTRQAFPSEEEQEKIYRKMGEALKGLPLVVRLFDIGGEKRTSLAVGSEDAKYFLRLEKEANPALGCRAIRFLLRFPDLLKKQLRALLKASASLNIRILIPMVSDLSELLRVREMLEEIHSELQQQGIHIPVLPPLGCMIETPAAALLSEVFLRHADFISLGTNDLVQYLFAVDRMNPYVSSLYPLPHPALLRLIQDVVLSAKSAGKELFVCGECASDPAMVPLLLGLGVRSFSMAARQISHVKKIVRSLSLEDAAQLVQEHVEKS
ncbi:MAG: phosphoenolpyruvate--protein phosphotransferase [Verrucomicrobiota bacterium]|nr:phosphoenolpyruvate--protein phosphotransferase [Verrucomicrobiota bacterium]